MLECAVGHLPWSHLVVGYCGVLCWCCSVYCLICSLVIR
jgi:succinate-acetate transporter protein